MSTVRYDLDREVAKDDYIKYSCPDTEELAPAPTIACECGFSGRVKYIISHLSEALCPECKKWMKFKETE